MATTVWLVFARWSALFPDDPVARYARWHSGHRGEVAAYRGFLDEPGVGAVVPMQELLRRGRRWRHCGEEEFAVPPSDR